MCCWVTYIRRQNVELRVPLAGNHSKLWKLHFRYYRGNLGIPESLEMSYGKGWGSKRKWPTRKNRSGGCQGGAMRWFTVGLNLRRANFWWLTCGRLQNSCTGVPSSCHPLVLYIYIFLYILYIIYIYIIYIYIIIYIYLFGYYIFFIYILCAIYIYIYINIYRYNIAYIR